MDVLLGLLGQMLCRPVLQHSYTHSGDDEEEKE